MLHPDTELRWVSEEIGFGVFATRPISRGTITWVLDSLDHRLSAERMQSLGPRFEAALERYGYLNARGERILCWDLARYMNHSCDPNVLSSGWDFDLAIRDIAAGEEVTTDYAGLNLQQHFDCACGSLRCRGSVRPGDFERLAEAWDEITRHVIVDAGRVAQPLWEILPDPASASAAIADPARLPTVLSHRYAPVSSPPPGVASGGG